MAAVPPRINAPEAGPSTSTPTSRAASPSPDPSRPLRRPASHGRLSKLMIPGRSRSGSSASQAETPLTAYADEVAPTSGRTTPEQRWRSGKAATASLLASDAKYKKFAGQVDKCLQSFESVNEWADFISFLSRLLKTLQIPSPAYTEIPRKLIVAKRLAQCLNPALPSGVHQRALDVYSHILGTIGPEGLRRDMLIWSSGLFPFFQFAATSVRPILLNIYEKYYLPLGEDLRPVTKALILALLPGMEEETGDFFDKVLSLLSRISDTVSPTFFLQNVFLVLLSSPASRLSGINYLSRKLVKPPEPDIKLDLGLLIRGVAAVLDDENSLVRRGGLDLLLRIFPLNGQIYKDADETDRRLLLRAAIAVVLQRELSLSRRVYTWLLGTEETLEAQVAYFKRYGLDILSSTLQADMEQAGAVDSADAQKPFKVFLSLLDKWEVGAALSGRLAVTSLEAVKHVVDNHPAMREEFIMTASAVYDAVEPIIVWREMFSALEEKQDDTMLRWIITALPQKDEEIAAVHIPVVLDHLLQSAKVRLPDHTMSTSRLISLSLDLARHAARGLFTHAPVSSAEQSTDLASSLYKAQTVDVDACRLLVVDQAVPCIVRNIFDLAVRPTPSVKDQLAMLELVVWTLDTEAGAISTIVGTTWIRSLVEQLSTARSFPVVDAVVATALQASQSALFKPPLTINHPSIISPILDTLFRFLRPDQTPHHARAVELLWDLSKLADIHTLENVIAKQLANRIHKQSIEAMEAFGTLWRLTDEGMLPGEIFYVPILGVLDSLRSSNPDVQRSAETWMRCNLKSYFRILDPVLSRLIIVGTGDGDVGHKEVDYVAVAYLVERVEILFNYGGSGLSVECQATEVAKSTHPTFVERTRRYSTEASTYLDLLVSLLLHHLSDAQLRMRSSERGPITKLQSKALDVLQILVGNGEISRSTLLKLRAALLDKLEACTKAGEITLQNKLLHILHKTITLSSHPPRNHRRNASVNSIYKDDLEAFEKSLARVIIEGVSSRANQGVLQHWVDFVLMIAPSLQSKPRIVHTLCDCFSLQTKSTVLQMREQLNGGLIVGRGVGDAEVIMLLSGLERLVTLSGSVSANGRSEEGRVGNEGGSGILGLVSGVFISDTPDDKSVISSAEWLGNVIEALLVSWSVTTPGTLTARAGQAMTDKIRDRTRQVLEKMCKTQMSGIIVGCIAMWAGDTKDITDEAIFDCIDTLTPSAQKVVEIVSESVVPKQGRPVEANTVSIMAFLEAYLSRLEAPIAVQIWSTMFGFARDMLVGASSPVAKAQLYPLLRCLTVLCKIVITTSALEDRRLRRELQDTYPKVLDAVVGNLNRIGEASAVSRSSGEKANGYTDYAQTVCAFLSESVIPNLRSFLVDADKVAAACSTISLNIVTPALKQYRADSSVLAIVYEMTRVPPAAKTWRFPVGDAFNDARFFGIDQADAVLWKPLICSLMETDKERFTELLSRITAAPSANIFTNREQEMITRSSNLRRLSFVLLAAEQNHYLAQLPAIQEKLVDILRTNVVSPRVHSEVYLCLRIIMCRISPQHLTNFWPVILAELLRVFEGIMEEIPPDNSESLQLALAACKFLDLLLTIQSEDFQVHQWIFVTDTTDAVYPPEDFSPDAIMDTIAEILRDHRHGEKDTVTPLPLEESGKMRRPRLLRAKKISSIRELEPFFSRASIENFECLYTASSVDWAAVEDGLQSEIFDR